MNILKQGSEFIVNGINKKAVRKKSMKNEYLRKQVKLAFLNEIEL